MIHKKSGFNSLLITFLMSSKETLDAQTP